MKNDESEYKSPIFYLRIMENYYLSFTKEPFYMKNK